MNISEFQDTDEMDLFYDRLNIRYSRNDILDGMKVIIKMGKANKDSDNVIKENIRVYLEPFSTSKSNPNLNKEVEDFMEKNNIK